MKRKAKFDLAMPIPVKLLRASEIVESMDGNPDFPTPSPPLADITTAIGNLQKAYQKALDRSLTAKAEQRTANEELNDLLRQLRDYVNGVAKGNEDIVLSSGFEASKIPEPVGPMPQVIDVKGKGGDGDGTVQLRWKPVYGAKNYVVEMSTDNVNYTPTGYPSAANLTVDSLTIGQFYWFRVAANGAAGLGPFSVIYKALAS